MPGQLVRDTKAIPVFISDDDGNPVSIGTGTGTGSSAPTTLPAGTNRGGTITTGGTAQQLAPANTSRRSFNGMNLSTGDLWINEIGGIAVPSQPSYRIAAGGTFSISTNQAVSIYGAATGQAFSATEA